MERRQKEREREGEHTLLGNTTLFKVVYVVVSILLLLAYLRLTTERAHS